VALRVISKDAFFNRFIGRIVGGRPLWIRQNGLQIGELVPDAEERFERAVQKLLKGPPIHRRNGKLADVDRPKSGRGRPRKHDATS
jgi:hypothetical protein